MKTREEVARFVEQQLDAREYQCPLEKGSNWHYGRQELRALLDFVYGGPPASPDQEVRPAP